MSVETVLITGASSGIGWELARQFAAAGSRLILVARREEKLKELAAELKAQHGTESIILPFDLAQPDAARQLFEKTEAEGLQVDVLVNNAGFGKLGLFHEIDYEWQSNMIQVNVQVLMQLTRLYLPQMVTRKQGHVLNVASTAAFQPGPHAAVYFATKAFVLSFSEAIWCELQGTGVHVTVLCPGPTRTGFGEDSQMDETLIFRYNQMDVEDVAAAAYRGMRSGRRLVMPGFFNNLLAWSIRITARPWVLWFTKRLQPLPRDTK